MKREKRRLCVCFLNDTISSNLAVIGYKQMVDLSQVGRGFPNISTYTKSPPQRHLLLAPEFYGVVENKEKNNSKTMQCPMALSSHKIKRGRT